MPSRPCAALGGMTLIGAALLGACGGGDGGDCPPARPGSSPQPVPAIQGRAIFGLTCRNNLVEFGSGNGARWRVRRLAGMTRRLDAWGSTSARRRPALRRRRPTAGSTNRHLSPARRARWPAPSRPGVSGEHFGLAFSGGAQDRLRLSSVEGNQNLSLDPLTGGVASADPDLAFAAGDANAGGNPAISALAYRETGTGSTLYAVDATANALVTVDPATGGLTTVGDFGRNVYLCSGLDIATDGTAYASLSTDNGSELYTVDLSTGAATLLGNIGPAVHSLAVAP